MFLGHCGALGFQEVPRFQNGPKTHTQIYIYIYMHIKFIPKFLRFQKVSKRSYLPLVLTMLPAGGKKYSTALAPRRSSSRKAEGTMKETIGSSFNHSTAYSDNEYHHSAGDIIIDILIRVQCGGD